MRRFGFGVAVVLLVGLLARQGSARQPCRGDPLNLELTLQEVLVDGVTVDGGLPGATESAIVFVSAPAELSRNIPRGCVDPVSPSLDLGLTDPFTNEYVPSLTFEAQP